MRSYAQKLKESKPFRLADGIMLAVFVLLCILPFLLPRNQGEIVRITYENKTEQYRLDGEQTLFYGNMTVRIHDGKVWVSKTDCPTRVCVHTGKISTAGESIVCVPNGLVIRIEGDAFDAASGGGA